MVLKFFCPACNLSVFDNWVTVLHKGSVIRCPYCKSHYRLLKEPGEKVSGELLEKITETFEDKLRAFNLLPITKSMVLYFEETGHRFRLPERFEYVKFYGGRPYLYSREFIEERSIGELLRGFRSIFNYIQREIEERPDDPEPGFQISGLTADGQELFPAHE